MLSALILTNIAFLPCLCYISTKVLVTSLWPPSKKDSCLAKTLLAFFKEGGA